MRPFDRRVFLETLVVHQRVDTTGCACGWAVLGASYAAHVADEYETELARRSP